MSYGVVVCPKCKRTKAFEEGSKSTTCPTCGRRLDVTSLRVVYRGEDEAQVREAMGRINARLAGEPEALEGVMEEGALEGTLESFGADADRPKRKRGGSQRERAERAARELAAAGEEGFSRTGFEEALEAEGVDPAGVDRWISVLVEQGVLYEPRPGRFQVLR